MSALQRRLSACSIAWLLSQVVSLCVLLPSELLSLQTISATTKDCLETTPAEQCPMHDVTGAPCPMHQGTTTENGTRECTIRGLSDGPAAAIAALLSIPGILLQESDTHVNANSSLLLVIAARVPDAPASLDSPPPKS